MEKGTQSFKLTLTLSFLKIKKNGKGDSIIQIES